MSHFRSPLTFRRFCKNDGRTMGKTRKIVTADGKNYEKKAKDGRRQEWLIIFDALISTEDLEKVLLAKKAISIF